MIVLASVSIPQGNGVNTNCEERVYNEHQNSNITTMDELASQTIKDIANLDCSMWIIQLFSNGGCFLWDAMERQLRTDGNLNSSSLNRVKTRLRGIVFDSSPADFRGTGTEVEERINRVLMQCTVKARLWLKIDLFRMGKTLKNGSNAAEEFWNRMKGCDWALPQLYIFSDNDILTPSNPLRDLVNFRKHKFGDIIKSKSFSSSPHCGHILVHEKDYSEALTNFLEFCCRHRSSHQEALFNFRSRL